MMSSQKRPSALTAKLPLKAIPIVDPNVGDAAGAESVAGVELAASAEETGDSAPPSQKSIAFDPSISEFVPQSAGEKGRAPGFLFLTS